MRAIDPEIRVGLLAEDNRDSLLKKRFRMRAHAINPRFDMVDAALCDAAHAARPQVLCGQSIIPGRCAR